MKNFLFKPNSFKETLRELLVFPSFATGWFIAELFKESPSPSTTICVIVVTIGLLWAAWAIAYTAVNNKR
jgi:hypothetical protein